MLYACKWGPCPSVFPSYNKLVDHLDTIHLTDDALNVHYGFPKGGYQEWLITTGRASQPGGMQSASVSPLVLQSPSAQANPIGEVAMPPHLIRTQDSIPGAKPHFKSLAMNSQSPACSPTPPIPSINASPSPSSLASRSQSHVPDLSPSPAPARNGSSLSRQLSLSSLQSTSTSRKRRHSGDLEVEGPAGSKSFLHTNRQRRSGSNFSASSRTSQSSQDVELQLTQDFGGEIRANSPVNDESSLDQQTAGISEGHLEKCSNPATSSSSQPHTFPKYRLPSSPAVLKDRPVRHSHPPEAVATTVSGSPPRTRRRTRSQTSQPNNTNSQASTAGTNTHNKIPSITQLLSRIRSRKTTPCATPSQAPHALKPRQITPANGVVRTTRSRSRAGSRAASVERQNQPGTKGRERKGSRRMGTLDEVAEEGMHIQEPALVEKWSETPASTTSDYSRPAPVFKSDVLSLSRDLGSSQPGQTLSEVAKDSTSTQEPAHAERRSGTPASTTSNYSRPAPMFTSGVLTLGRDLGSSRTRSQPPSPPASNPSEIGYQYASNQLQLLTQKPYHYPSQDSAGSQETQTSSFPSQQHSQDGSGFVVA
ncbi:hypothetical protein PHLGIDRAFT_116740 [Phlebiopsis gigantea 11061_1 CR5-6]|uniref:C2H2-type domain-containing protein n=1 Tax=Phlebiopsis gigantea (strain 11061_1 CR5-6) TaxID=745531 RepID=A0A0C3NUL6_PHLG1|nr:hypothetical protein PHLGIDRAFT_116740 [Phlebiopsis gigantea 11061_1 CR5-6]